MQPISKMSLKMVCVHQNGFPHYCEGEGRKQAQQGARACKCYAVSLSIATHSSPLWPLSYSTVLPVRCVCTFCKLCTCHSKGVGFSGTTASGRSPHPPPEATGWNPLGHSLLSFQLKKCYVQMHLTLSYLSSPVT